MCKSLKEQIIAAVNETEDDTWLWMVMDFINALRK